MKKFATLLSLFLMFTLLPAWANATNAPTVNGSFIIEGKQLPFASQTSVNSVKTIGLLAETIVAIANQPVVVRTKFRPPPIKIIFMAPKVTLPLIGWGNTDCYGGTGTKLARG